MTADGSQAPSTNRRRHPRYTLPLTVLIGATPYVVTDWSEGGVRLRDYRGAFGYAIDHADAGIAAGRRRRRRFR